jgi:hypothetical protein
VSGNLAAFFLLCAAQADRRYVARVRKNAAVTFTATWISARIIRWLQPRSTRGSDTWFASRQKRRTKLGHKLAPHNPEETGNPATCFIAQTEIGRQLAEDEPSWCKEPSSSTRQS